MSRFRRVALTSPDPPWLVHRATNLGPASSFGRPGEGVRSQDVSGHRRALS